MTQIIGIEPQLKTTKIKVAAGQLGMIATIMPARIIGSEVSRNGFVTLVVQAPNLPDSKYSTLDIKTEGGKMVIEIVGLQ